MKTSIKTILAVVAMGATAIAANAAGVAATPKIVTIDLAKAFVGYWRTAEENTKIESFQQSINNQGQGIIAEGKAIGDKLKSAQDTFNSPVATDIAKQQAQADYARFAQELQKKQAEFDDFRQKAGQQLQQSALQTRQALLSEIIAKAGDIGKNKGANMVLDRGSMVYADPTTEITDEVLAALNVGHPMPAATGTPAPAVGYPATK